MMEEYYGRNPSLEMLKPGHLSVRLSVSYWLGCFMGVYIMYIFWILFLCQLCMLQISHSKSIHSL